MPRLVSAQPAAHDAGRADGWAWMARSMETTMRHLFAAFFFSFLFLSVLAVPAPADSPQVHVRGAIQSVSGGGFTLAPAGGTPVPVTWNEQTKFTSLQAAQIADIAPGLFVGTAAIPQPD